MNIVEKIKGQRIGYMRVSSDDQHIDRQLDGIQLDKKFIEIESGKKNDRPVLAEMLRYAREGDIIIVHEIDRLGRNLPHLRKIVDDLLDRKIELHFIKEGIRFIGRHDPITMLLFNMVGAVSEWEISIRARRQREGIEQAKKRGVYKGRLPMLGKNEIIRVQEMNRIGIPKLRIARELGCGKDTIYKALRTEVQAA